MPTFERDHLRRKVNSGLGILVIMNMTDKLIPQTPELCQWVFWPSEVGYKAHG